MRNQLVELKIRPGLRWRVHQRLAVLELADRLGQKRAAERVGLCPRTIWRWQARARPGGASRLSCHATRCVVGVGSRITWWPWSRTHGGSSATAVPGRRCGSDGCTRSPCLFNLAMSTVQRLVVELPYLRRYPKRAARQLKLFERPRPGDCVQVDVKFVKVAHRWMYQYTALDDCTRLRVLRLYRTSTARRATDFSPNCATPFRSISGAFRMTTARNSPSPSRSRSRPRGSAIATSAHGGPSRTGRSSAAIGSTTRSSGAAMTSATSPTRQTRSAAGSMRTTTSASRSLYRAAHPLRSSRPCPSRPQPE